LLPDAEMRVEKMKKDRELIDPNFGGYKLSLEAVAKSTEALGPEQRPAHRQPGPAQYGFLHAKLFGEHNHLVSDPWGEAVHWVAAGGEVCRGGQGGVAEVWRLPEGEAGGEGRYNARLLFLGETVAAVSDGLGMLYLLDTGPRGQAAWSLLFQGDVCGRGRAFQVAGGMVLPAGGLEVVLHYVEQRDKVEGAGLPGGGEGSDFLNCFDWISLVPGPGGLMMERVRRVATLGGVNCVAVVEGEGGEPRLVLSAEKAATIVFDSMNPIEEVEEVVPVNSREEAAEGAPVFYWSQLGGEDLEVWVYAGEVVRSLVKVTVEGRLLVVEVRGAELVRGQLAAAVEQDSWTWSLEGGKLSVLLCKAAPGPWPGLWGAAGGSLGEQVTEQREDKLLAHLTTDSPMVDALPEQPGFNTEELEACDACDTQDRLVWLGGGEPAVASLEGRQHLLTLPSVGGAAPQLCTRHDVDGLVWRLGGARAEHVATFPALGYVQASKQSRKFLAAPASARYSVICDASRHLYLYRQPEALAAELGLRNRRSGEKVERVARQLVVTLEGGDQVLGLVAGEAAVSVLTMSGLTTVAVS
jgi:hypothetical protein